MPFDMINLATRVLELLMFGGDNLRKMYLSFVALMLMNQAMTRYKITK